MFKFFESPFLKNWRTWLILVLLISVFTRFWRLDYVKEYVFDEVYHAFTAKMYSLDRYEAWVWWTSPPEGVAYEWTHPPLAKVIMSWGIDLFGGPGELPTKIADPQNQQNTSEQETEKSSNKILANWSFGWRFFSALFGVIATLGIFLLVSSVFKNNWIGVISAFLFTFDLLPLVQSRVAMNDIFAVTFVIYAYYFFTKRIEMKDKQDKDVLGSPLLNYRLSVKHWLASGLMIGCAVSSKWTSFFALGLMIVYQACTVLFYFYKRFFDKSKFHSKFTFKLVLVILIRQFSLTAALLLLIPLIIYLLSYWQLFSLRIPDYQGNSLYEVMQNNRWDQDFNNVDSRLKLAQKNECTQVYAPEFCNIDDLKKELREIENKKLFWSNLYRLAPYLSDRLYIWWGLQQQMWWYHTNLEATHSYQSQWWQWPLNLRPVWFYVKYCDSNNIIDKACVDYYKSTSDSQNATADIYTMGNPVIFWMIFVVLGFVGYYTTGNYRKWFYSLIPAVLILLVQLNINLSRKNDLQLADILSQGLQTLVPQVMLFGMLLLLFLSLINLVDTIFDKKINPKLDWYYMPLIIFLFLFCSLWLPWAKSPRIMFFYHFFPPMTFFYPLMAFTIYKLFKSGRYYKLAVGTYILIIIAVFVYFYPHVTGELVPNPTREGYFWLSSWK